MKLVQFAAAALLAACLAACGSSSTVTSVRTVVVPARTVTAAPSASSGSGTATSPPAPSTSVATASSTAATTSATATTTSASASTAPGTETASVASGPACTAGDLSVSYEGSNGALGTLVGTFLVRNAGAGPCHTYGYPGVLFLDGNGAPLPTQASRTTHDVLGPTPPKLIELRPGETAGFRIVSHSNPTGTSCTTAYGLQVIAPDDTATLRAKIPSGYYECASVTLSPLIAGNAEPPGT